MRFTFFLLISMIFISCSTPNYPNSTIAIYFENLSENDSTKIENVLNIYNYVNDEKDQSTKLLPLAQSIRLFNIIKTKSDTINHYLDISQNFKINFRNDKKIEIKVENSTEIVDSLNQLAQILEKQLNLKKSYGNYTKSTIKHSFGRNIIMKNLQNTNHKSEKFYTDSFEAKFHSLNKLSNNEQYNFKLKELLKGIQKSKESTNYSILQSEILLHLKKYKEAFDILANLYKNKQYSGKLFYLLSKTDRARFLNLGFKNEVDLWMMAYEYIAGDAEFIETLGDLFFKKEFRSYGEKCYIKLVGIYPDNLYLKSRLSIIQRGLHKTIPAEKLLRECLEQEPENWQYLYQYGTLLYYKTFYSDKTNKQAESVFKKAISCGDTLDSYIYLGKIYFHRKEYTKALEFYKHRVKHSYGKNDDSKYQAMKGIRKILKILKENEAKK